MHKILFFLAAGPIYLLSKLPVKVHYFIASLFGFFLFRVFGYRRDVITINISRSFPKIRYGDITKIRRKFYRNFSHIVAENFKLISANKKQLERLAIIENPQLLRKFHERGLPLIVVGGHFGNWELLSHLKNMAGGDEIGYDENHLCSIYKKQSSQLADKLVTWKRLRGRCIRLVESETAARTILKNRDKPVCYFLFSDQSPKPGSRFVVNFLGQQTLMINGPEVISRAAELPVVYMEMDKREEGNYILRFFEITENAAKCEKGYVTAKFAEFLERSITSNPPNWLWSHKRWKRGIEEN